MELTDSAGGAPVVNRQREYFRFNGTGSEYFRIWIVNLSLTVLTLGLYSPWAKVRRNRYVYGNVSLADSHFDYIADPLKILRGRLIALSLLIAYIASSVVAPIISSGFALLLFGGTPWLLVRSRMFNMRYTTYRNIRFAFRNAYAHAFGAILGGTLLAIITLGFALPYAHYMRNQMVVDNTRFGQLDFSLGQIARKFYKGYMFAAFLTLLLLVVGGLVLGSVRGLLPEAAAGSSNVWIVSLMPLGYLLAFYFIVVQFLRAFVLRATINATILSDAAGERHHQLGCDWSMRGMLAIYLTNVLAIALSFGLLVPWAQMRILRYQLDNTWVDVDSSLDDVIAGQQRLVSSIGEEIGDVFDVDIGL